MPNINQSRLADASYFVLSLGAPSIAFGQPTAMAASAGSGIATKDLNLGPWPVEFVAYAALVVSIVAIVLAWRALSHVKGLSDQRSR